jgi:DNA-binding transcriptional LysR family regulator
VALAELRNEDFVGYDAPDSVVATTVTQACLAAGFLPRRTHEVSETSIILTLVAAGLGVALLPESVLALRVDGVSYVPVADDVAVDLALAWRSGDPSPALTRLVEALEANGFVAADAVVSPPSPPHAAPLGGAR